MTLALRSRRRSDHDPDGLDDAAVFTDVGIHRDPSQPDPIASGTFAQRLVHRVSAALGGSKTSRRSFLTKTAVVGSALAVGPLDFVLKPGTAYGYLCGTCSDGWTAFCCTINSGRNACPPGSFVAGWWKADNAAYCCGSARYIIDCNATCPTQCSCRCGGGSCDNRRTCCNQFRYGQCHTEIACYGPVVCRVATCVVPWVYDPSCTTTVRTDNRTVDHGAPCLTTDCGTPIAKKYAALGGSAGLLGPPTGGEADVGDGRGRFAGYRNGSIYWTPTTGAHEVHGSLATAYFVAGGPKVAGYPTMDTHKSHDGRWEFTQLEKGRIYRDLKGTGTFTVLDPIFAKHESMNGIKGYLGYPIANERATDGGALHYQDFSMGRIFRRGTETIELHGFLWDFYLANGGGRGRYGYPTTDLVPVGDGRGKTQTFEHGQVWHTKTTGTRGLYGGLLTRYLDDGGPRGPQLGYPTSGFSTVGDGIGSYATFEHGNIYSTPATRPQIVRGSVRTFYLQKGGPTGVLGYPTGELALPGGSAPRRQTFQHGTVEVRADGSIVIV